ncbi:hypothetical protein MLD38_022790 [Melastoma candidum]|uniref:Uncharacterized protein n=1 Tax=Melastoma candidum TaxID=119954 RepID=A0ACB9QM92_9MYRT|nr:hypothetical protein MLD38_022790 [Melastoma candidum]
MSDCDGNKGTSSAIAENKQGNRGGGCVGILFQLFDWHRRFAKKQLFKRKLLPPPPAVKKFKGDEKMPTAKLHLIADENNGGFPAQRKNGTRNVDAEHKHGTQAPGLVARLMGLETMPFVHNKLNRNPSSENYSDKWKKSVAGSRGIRKEDLDEEKGDKMQVLRPPKLQKTGELDRRVASRFGGEALQIKNVLARSKKHHHHKLVTPVKNPRTTPRNNMSRTSSRLIDAATKILEPGLQNKRRAKCALPYSSSSRLASVELDVAERCMSAPANMRRHAPCKNLASKHSMGQPLCKNCGNLLDIKGCGPTMMEEICSHPSTSPRHFDYSCLDGERPARTAVVPQKTIFYKGRQLESLAADSLSECHGGGKIKYVEPFMDSSNGWPVCGQNRSPREDDMAVEETNLSGSRNGSLKARSASRSLSVPSSYYKDFVAHNRVMSSRTHPRSLTRADCSQTDVARRSHTRRSESLFEVKPPLPKTRSSIEHPTSAICLLAKQKSSSELPGKGNRARYNENSNGIVSFAFKSTKNYTAGHCSEGKNKRTGPNDFSRKICSESKSTLGENLNNRLQQKHFALSGDALGAFWEQTLKELTSQEEEATMPCKMSKRSTDVILQGLTTAVTVEESPLQYGATADSMRAFQMKPGIHGAAKVLPDANSLSPGSVLEVSFSNDSCISRSSIFDDISGSKLNVHPVDYSIDSLRPIVHDVELLDSATSLNMGGSHFIELTYIIGRVASMMDSLILADGRLTGSKVNLAKDIILNAELLFASFSPENSNCLEDVIRSLLQTESAEVKALFSLGDAEVGTEMKAFTLDCLLECFDKGYCRYSNFGYQGWAKQLSSWSPELLELDIVKEAQRWTSLSGLTLDEIIEHDMSHLIGKWTDFDIETLELGAAFADDMLSDAVEEITVSIGPVG